MRTIAQWALILAALAGVAMAQPTEAEKRADALVVQGVGGSRSAVIRQGVHHLAESVRRAAVGEAIAESYRSRPQTGEDDELAMASAIALTEAEPW